MDDTVEGTRVEMDDAILGATRLEDLAEIMSRKPVQYSTHEHGWFVFYVRQLDWQGAGQELSVGRVQIGLVDALGNSHIVEKPNAYSFRRCNLQSNTRNTIQQFVTRLKT